MKDKKIGIEILALIAVIGGNVIFGFSFLFSKIALGMVQPSVLIAIRFTVAFIALNIIVLVGKKVRNGIAFSLKGKPVKPILTLALCQPVIYFIAEGYGIKMTSSSFAGIIIALIPIVGILADAFVMHTKVGARQVVCAILSVVGVAFTTIGASDLTSSAAGLALLLIAVVAGAMFYVFSKNAAEYYNPLERTYVMFMVGSAVYIVIAAIQSIGRFDEVAAAVSTPVFWACIGYLALLSSVVAFLLLNFGSNYISVSRATLMANSTTIISIIAGVLVLDESFSVFQIIGAVIIILSVTVGNDTKSK